MFLLSLAWTKSLAGTISLPLPNSSKAEAIEFIHNPYMLAAINPLITDGQPSAKGMKSLEHNQSWPMLNVTTEKVENGFVSVWYRARYPFGLFGSSASGTLAFTLVAKDLSPNSVEVRTTGPNGMKMTEIYKISEDAVEKKVTIPRHGSAIQSDLDEGLEWNEFVWKRGLDG